MTPAAEPGLREAFAVEGFSGPIRVFGEDEAHRIRRRLEAAPRPADWFKGHAARSPAWFAIGSHPAIVDPVAEILGDDVMLWGASLVRRPPGTVHPWHTDIETSADAPGTVTVWIGLEHTSRESALQWIARSHTFGVSLQARAGRAGRGRADVTTGDVVRWSGECDPGSRSMRLDLGDGEALLLDGRLWHASHNTGRRARTALLLQYARPDRPIRIPDPARLEHPFRFLDGVRPPCVLVRGHARGASNRIVPAPGPGDRAATSWVHPLQVPLAPAPGEAEAPGWTIRRLASGPTRCLQHLLSHASTLAPGTTPHEPEGHPEEEILVMLGGSAEVRLLDETGGERREAIEPGTVAYYPPEVLHTISAPFGVPASYVVFKWRSGRRHRTGASLPFAVHRCGELRGEAEAGHGAGWTVRPLFEGPTPHLSKLRCHVSTLRPGAGYEPHADTHDVVIVVFQGTVETLGQRVGPHGVVFYGAGEPHGIRNPGGAPAVYLVVEFHGPILDASPAALRWRLAAGLRRRLRDRVPRPLRRAARAILGRGPGR